MGEGSNRFTPERGDDVPAHEVRRELQSTVGFAECPRRLWNLAERLRELIEERYGSVRGGMVRPLPIEVDDSLFPPTCFDLWDEIAPIHSPIHCALSLVEAIVDPSRGARPRVHVSGENSDCVLESLIVLGLDLGDWSPYRARLEIIWALCWRDDLPGHEDARAYVSHVIESRTDPWTGAPPWFMHFLSIIMCQPIYTIELRTSGWHVFRDCPSTSVGGDIISCDLLQSIMTTPGSRPLALLITTREGDRLPASVERGLGNVHASPVCEDWHLINLLSLVDNRSRYQLSTHLRAHIARPRASRRRPAPIFDEAIERAQLLD